jgi:HD-GYP domain-containing protein (c-di-GMP phosphodiesterase class II)
MALAGCREQAECEVVLRGETYLSLPMHSVYFGDGHLLRSLQSVDSAAGPVQSILRSVFLITGIGALFAALVLGVLSSRSIVKPIASVIFRLRESEKTGLLPEFDLRRAPVLEIRELSESFNRAAGAIREARENLHSAYVEFIGSLASALDARDPYTAGHSHRVSQFACAIARALNFSDEKLEEIRIGALLHDIGKIGIADSVLQKRGRLTGEEWELIKQHPAIGRRILEGVHGFHDYLPTVELHHENWDGTGYPHGQRGEETPIAARIVHVADAYDAMTSDRPYRPGMSRARALELLRESAGTQFDPAIVPIFVRLMETGGGPALLADSPEPASIHTLADEVATAGVEQSVAEDA